MNGNNSSTVLTGCKSTLSPSTAITTAFPFQNELGTSLLFLLICIFEYICEYKLKIPGLLGAILAGMVCNVLKIVPYPESFSFLGKLGVMLLVLESSLQVEVNKVKQVGLRAFFAAFSGVITPVSSFFILIAYIQH
jgi:Kef-type K+ transport system membrane component KefB